MNPNKEVMVGAAAVILLAGIFWVMAYADIDWLRILVLFSLAGIAAQVFGKDLNTERIISFTVASRHLKYLKYGLLGIVVLAADLWLLRYFNTLLWPYLWPRPGLFLLLAVALIFIWFHQRARRIWVFWTAGVLMLFIGQCYVLHSFQVAVAHPSLTAIVHLLGAVGTSLVMCLNFVNQLRPRYKDEPRPLPENLPVVAALVPTYNEPLPILERTVRSLKQLDYPADRLCIVVSDDGHRAEVQQMARRLGVGYNYGARREAKAGNLNSALLYLKHERPDAELILTQDADEVIDPLFLQKVVGYFNAPKIAFVQTPKEVLTPYGDPFGTRDRLFYDRIQPGRNGSGAAFSCGSGVLWRISAVREVGGFDTWNLVEDLTTSYKLHSAGYRSQYHNEILSIGLAPDDIPNLLKQRGTWAADTWRLFLFRNPLLMPGLTLRQRRQYLELCLFYLTSVFFIPLLMAVPLLSLFTGQFLPIQGAALFPWMAISFIYYASLSRSQAHYLLRMWQYWVGHWPTYTKALWIALRSRDLKPQYKVTRKTRQNGFYGYLLWPQFLYIFVGVILSLRAWFWMPEINRIACLTNIGIFSFFALMLWGICQASFYGVKLPNIP